MKQLLFLAAVLAASLHTYAQNALMGKVFDAATNIPLSGATITLSGKSTTSDKEGTFSIPCGGGTGKLVISYIGYTAYYQPVKNCGETLLIGLTPLNSTLAEVEITATSAQNKSLLNQPASITKLSKIELDRSTGLFLDDAINTNVPGVTMNRRAVSSGQQFNIRGYGNGTRGTAGVSSNFDGQGYKVYLNGIPVTDAEGITLMDDIDFGSVGNVEVTKGPAGTLYGLAIAGAVNLKTVRPEAGKTSISQQVLLGNYGLQRYTTTLQSGMERSSVLLNYGHQESKGFSVHNASHKDFVNLAGEFQPSARQAVMTYFGYSNSYDQRAGELTISQYETKNYVGNAEYIKRDAHSNILSFRGGVGHRYSFSNRVSNNTTVFGNGIMNNSSSAAAWTDKNPINLGMRSTFDTKFSLNNSKELSGITGVETQHQYAQTISYNMSAYPGNPSAYWIIDTIRSNQFTYSGTYSYFTEWTLSLPKGLSITAGVGLSTMHIRLEDRYHPRGSTRPNALYQQDYNGLFSPHFAVNKIFNKQFSLYASYSSGYKAPVSSYFFIPATGQLNTGLKPEKGDQFEVGNKGSFANSRINYELSVFHAVFSDKMTSEAVPLASSPVTTAYSYVVNGGKQVDNGIEASLKWNAYQGNGFVRSITPFANFTYSDFKYKDFVYKRFRVAPNTTKDSTVDYSGKAVAGVAPIVFNMGFDIFTMPGLYLNAYYNYKDAVPITSDGLYHTKSYNLLNGKIGFRRSLSQHFDLDAHIGATNLTGTQYYYMIFVNQLPDAYLPAPLKAAVFGGINLKYNF
ncbi:MAG: outer rane receptor protein [Flaviaesturariibacter sp.]|nr:outer rane receptor protein [Flaviaesturariibacter sp.]